MADKQPTTREGRHQSTRTRIKKAVGQIVPRLAKHAKGEIEMTATQIQAAKILINKVIPDLKAVEVTHKGQDPMQELFDRLQDNSRGLPADSDRSLKH